MKLFEVCLIIMALLCCYLVWLNQAENSELITSHHDYIRKTELELANLKSRVSTLESMKIDINIIDHTGIYSVFGVAVK